MKTNDERPKAVAYLFVLLIQISGAMLFVWQQLPEFRQIAVNPGEQLPHDTFSDVVTVGILFVMQISFWCRLLYIPIPFRRPNIILNHVFLFLCRLSFIFGSALFSIVVFRHLPELSWEIDIFLPGVESYWWDVCSRCFAPVLRWNDWVRHVKAIRWGNKEEQSCVCDL